MDFIKIQLAAIWIALMLIYLLGDVLRIFSGNFEAGKIEGQVVSQMMWVGIAALMVVPILMILVTIMADYSINRWANIIVAAFFFLMNIVSIHTYPGYFDRFLLAISLGFNVLSIWYAWHWVI